MLLSISGRYGELLSVVGQTVELARAVRDDELVAEAEVKRGIALLSMVGGLEEALRALQEAIRLGEAAGGMTNLAGWFNTVAGMYLESGEFGLSQSYRTRGLEVAERQGYPAHDVPHVDGRLDSVLHGRLDVRLEPGVG